MKKFSCRQIIFLSIFSNLVCLCPNSGRMLENVENMLRVSGNYELEEPLMYRKFPDNFTWGVATASYQIEGGWDADGKGLNIWDVFTQDHSNIVNGDDGRVACNSYHKYMEDVQLIRAMGLKAYRFSFSWARILPTGNGSQVNELGVQYYSNLIDELLANGIEPMGTMYHWDLPQSLQDQGGWLNPDIALWFESYAGVLFERFGSRIKKWITINEPWVVAISGHANGDMAPGIKGPGIDDYKSAHNLIRAHAKAYRLYKRSFAGTQHGQVSITLNANWCEPKNSEKFDDVEAAEIAMQFSVGWFAKPILVDGQYPEVMRDKVDRKSKKQGYAQSRLPTFTEEESREIAGSADFLGINHYTTELMEKSVNDNVSWAADRDVIGHQDSIWYSSASSWLKVTPFGFRRLLKWLDATYGSNLEIYITENGVSDHLGNLDDMHRIYYMKHYINQLLKAVKLDNANVKGYFAWSLLDNFEWARGYSEKFGLHFVDFDDPTRPRKAKASAKFYKVLAAENGFSPDHDSQFIDV